MRPNPAEPAAGTRAGEGLEHATCSVASINGRGTVTIKYAKFNLSDSRSHVHAAISFVLGRLPLLRSCHPAVPSCSATLRCLLQHNSLVSVQQHVAAAVRAAEQQLDDLQRQLMIMHRENTEGLQQILTLVRPTAVPGFVSWQLLTFNIVSTAHSQLSFFVSPSQPHSGVCCRKHASPKIG